MPTGRRACSRTGPKEKSRLHRTSNVSSPRRRGGSRWPLACRTLAGYARMGGIPEFHRNILSCASSIIKPRMSPQCPKRFLYPKHCRPHGNSECLPLEPVWYQNWIEEKRRKSRGLRIEGLEGMTLRSAGNGVQSGSLSEETAKKRTSSPLPLPGSLGRSVVRTRAAAAGRLPQGGEPGPQGQARPSQPGHHGR